MKNIIHEQSRKFADFPSNQKEITILDSEVYSSEEGVAYFIYYELSAGESYVPPGQTQTLRDLFPNLKKILEELKKYTQIVRQTRQANPSSLEDAVIHDDEITSKKKEILVNRINELIVILKIFVIILMKTPVLTLIKYHLHNLPPTKITVYEIQAVIYTITKLGKDIKEIQGEYGDAV